MSTAAAAARSLGRLLTESETRDVADRLEHGQSVRRALRCVDDIRRRRVHDLMTRAGLADDPATAVLVLRAIEGARRDQPHIGQMWTMPGTVARWTPLTTQIVRHVDAACTSVTCSTYNFQTSSAQWEALKRASARLGGNVRIYMDRSASESGGSPGAGGTAGHLAPALVLRTKHFMGKMAINHAKFIVIDHRMLIVTSANFSWSAENRNVEFGLQVEDESLARSVESQMASVEPYLYERVT